MSIHENEKLTYDKEKASAWQYRYSERLDEILSSEKPDREAFLDMLWNYAILERIAPTSLDEKSARIKLGKAVWEGDRKSSELYWRILYSVGSAREKHKRRYSVIASPYGFVTGIFDGIFKLMSDRDKMNNFFPETKEDPMAICNIVFDYVSSLASQELINRGENPHDDLIPWGASGTWEGINVSINKYAGYTDDGLVVLKANNPEDHMRIFNLSNNNGNVVSPSRLNPNKFSLE